MRKNQDISVSLFAFFVGFTPLTVFFSQYFGYFQGVIIGSPWLPMSGWLLIGSLVFILIKVARGENILVNTQSFAPLLVLVVWFGLSSIWAANKYLVFVQWLYWAAASIGFLLVVSYRGAKNLPQMLMWCIFTSGVISSVLGLCQYYFDVDLVFQSRPPSSFFGNKNMAAQFSLLIIPLGIALFLLSNPFLVKAYVLTGSALALIFTVIVSSSAVTVAMFGMISLAALYITNVFIRKKHRSFLSFYVFIIAFIVVAAIFTVAYKFDYDGLIYGSFSHGDELFSIQLRVFKWFNAWEIFKDNVLLGVGLNNWYIVYPLYHQVFGIDAGVSLQVVSDHAHSDLLQVLVETGLIGGAILSWLLISVFRATRTILKFQTQENKIIAGGCVFSLVAIFSVSLFSFPLQLPFTIYLVVILFGVLSRLSNHMPPEVIPTKGCIPFWCSFLIFFSMLWSIALYYCFYNADIFYRKSHHYFLNKQFNEAREAADAAVTYNPYRYETLKYRAASYHANNHDSAEEMLLLLVDNYPNSLNSLTRLFDFYMQKNEYLKALSVAVKIRTISPRSDYAHQNMVLVYGRLKNQKGFVLSLSKLKEINGEHYLVRKYMGEQGKKY